MKLWYQSTSRHDDNNPYRVALKKILARAVDPGSEIEIHSITETAGIAADYRVMEYLDTRQAIFNAAQAQKQGYDAFLVGNILECGLREAREMTDIPVLGLTETSLSFAGAMGANFALITINEKFTPRLVEIIHRYGFGQRLAGIHQLQTNPEDLKRAFAEPQLRRTILAQFTKAAQAASAGGAEVLIPCGGVLTTLLIEQGVHQIERIPVVNGIIELVKFAEMAVKVRALTGRFTSKRLSYAPPTGETLRRIREFYGPDIYPGAE
ncbi:MAG: hypothetical protein HY525_20350 [Betaproteobacteria bacterium]|nr:hypothetical protein [Betaproteobacteria bacterium]